MIRTTLASLRKDGLSDYIRLDLDISIVKRICLNIYNE